METPIDYTPTPAHYESQESFSPTIPICRELIMKQMALESMNYLEGWCSHEKALILMDLILAMKPQCVVEIGVFGGKSLISMAFAMRHNQCGKIFGIDPWDSQFSIMGMEQQHKEWWLSIDHEEIFQGLVAKIKAYELSSCIELIRATSEQALIPNQKIDLLHIDGNHSDEASLLDVTKWVPQVRSGGLIIFDDLDWETTSRATQWLDANCKKITEIRGSNVWGIWEKR